MAATAPAPAPVHIDVVSDVVCPWCYIGKRRLERAIESVPDIAVEVSWVPYFLNPWIPPEGIDRRAYLEAKFGSVERYRAIAAHVVAAAAAEGLTYAPDRIGRQPNTLDCHRLILWSRNSIEPSRMKQRLMELYFAEGADLSDRQTLVAASLDCGMDGDLVRQLLAGDADVDRIKNEADGAKEAGIDGVPCFVIGGAMVMGAQAPEHLARAIERAGEQARMRA